MASTTPSNSAPGSARSQTDRWLRVALVERSVGNRDALRQALAQAAEAARPDAEANALLGDFFSRADMLDDAHAAYDRAVGLRPDRAAYWFNRAAVARFLGRLAEAEADYDRCLVLDPADTQACLNRSELRVQTPERNHLAQLEGLLRQSWPWQRAVPLRYALAKEYEDLGQYALAWVQLAEGAALRRRHLQYDAAVDLNTVQWLIDAFPGNDVRAGHGAGNAAAEPIFILGMPRTGSTLVDRIVGSHSQVKSAGELPHFGNAVVGAARRRLGRAGLRQELIAASATVDFAALGADYLARTRPATGTTPRFTDKLPLNYLYCGLIDRALPGASMVHVRRHPLATCFAVFKVLFDQGYPFSYDLGEIADYYIAYSRLMTHWQATLPGRIIDISYEALVTDTPAQSRGLIRALDLRWEDACREFHRNPAPVTTASASQIRRPIYTSALNLWRNYESELAPLRARLEAAGIACGD